MKKERSLFDLIALVFKGILMGAANKVPGVSGGIIAYVGGFYEEFIYSLKQFNGKAASLLFKGDLKNFFRHVNGKFLSLLILGMLISYFSIAQALDYLITHYEIWVWSCFFGMILGSVHFIAKQFDTWSTEILWGIGLGGIVGVMLAFIPPIAPNDHLLYVFLCGIISVTGMTLPGLSGSFLLILLGNYVLLLVDSVNALYLSFGYLIKGDFQLLQESENIRLLKVLAVFTLGSITGLVSLSHLLVYVLKKFRKLTTSIILGFIIGSTPVVWPWKKAIYKLSETGQYLLDSNGHKIVSNYSRYWPDWSTSESILAMVFMVTGFLIVYSIEYYGRYRST